MSGKVIIVKHDIKYAPTEMQQWHCSLFITKDNEVVLSTVFQIQIFYLRYIFENFNIGAILKYKIVEIVTKTRTPILHDWCFIVRKLHVCSSRSERKFRWTTWELLFRTRQKLQFTTHNKLRYFRTDKAYFWTFLWHFTTDLVTCFW